MGRKNPSARGGDDEQQPAPTNSKKTAVQIVDDEYSLSTELSEEPKFQEEKIVISISRKKKGKKGNHKCSQQDDDDDGDFPVPEIAFVGKRKKSNGKTGAGSVSFALLDDEDDKESDVDVDDKPLISFTGKKHASNKGKKGGNSFAASAFDARGSDDAEDVEEEVSSITFTAKNSTTNSFSAALLDAEEETDATTYTPGESTLEDRESPKVMFLGKKKSSKKKGSNVSPSLGDDSVADESSQAKTHDTKSVEVVETGKSKKKKKNMNNNKSGRTVQEEDDLDKLLAELGEATVTGRPASFPPQQGKVQAQPGPVAPIENAVEKEGGDETVESAAAKKKKKKKEKKAAAGAAATSSVEAKEEKREESVTDLQQPKKKDAKGKAAEKKIPKHVREMQEALARRQEAEERKKKEVEEKLRKEEEERRRQEELEAQAEEAKHKRKEKEKEKLLRKKQEGKLLTTKQKSEALKREAFKNQLLAAGGGLPVADIDGEATSSKRPIYANKKKSSRQKGNGTSVQAEDEVEPEENHVHEPDPSDEVGSADSKKVDLIESYNTEEKSESADVSQENAAEEDDEWDVKSWDTVDLNLKDEFDDEEEAALPVVEKELEGTVSKAQDSVLVVDIMHGLKPQTIESLDLLRKSNTEFIVALNKVDRLYGWKTCKNAPILKAMKQQTKDVTNDFNRRLTGIITQFKEQGLNTELYYENKEMGETFSIVPISAISGEGISDLLLLLVQWAQKTMVEKLTYVDKVQCTVLEVKVIEGHGTTIDVVLVNGKLHVGDQIVVCGLEEPIVTTIRALLTPHPMKELRVKGNYVHYKEIKAAQCIKITAQGLEHALAGPPLHVVGPDDDIEAIKKSVVKYKESVLSRIDKSGEGVYVQASTLGSVEALIEELEKVKIPVGGFGIGPVHKKDILKAGVMLERKKEFATIVAFEVELTKEVRELAEEMKVKIFCVGTIYNLSKQVEAYIDNIKEDRKKESADEAVFPCVLKILREFRKKDPIVLGVDVIQGILKIGTPICVRGRKVIIDIGRIDSIENNHKPIDSAKKDDKVAIRIVGSNAEFGTHFKMKMNLRVTFRGDLLTYLELTTGMNYRRKNGI